MLEILIKPKLNKMVELILKNLELVLLGVRLSPKTLKFQSNILYLRNFISRPNLDTKVYPVFFLSIFDNYFGLNLIHLSNSKKFDFNEASVKENKRTQNQFEPSIVLNQYQTGQPIYSHLFEIQALYNFELY